MYTSSPKYTMQFYIIFLCTMLKNTKAAAVYDPYCHTSCGKEHTVCRYRNCEVVCGSYAEKLPLSNNERLMMLHLHNQLRNDLSPNGTMYRRFPRAIHLPAVSYDLELEYVAQCWANRCFEDGDYDECRITSKYPIVTQNYFRTTVRLPKNRTDKLLKLAFTYWSQGATFIGAGDLDYYLPNPGDSDFVKIASMHTVAFGCGRIRYGLKDGELYTVICNYASKKDPVALGATVYMTIARNQSCPSTKDYPGLCGKIVPHKLPIHILNKLYLVTSYYNSIYGGSERVKMHLLVFCYCHLCILYFTSLLL